MIDTSSRGGSPGRRTLLAYVLFAFLATLALEHAIREMAWFIQFRADGDVPGADQAFYENLQRYEVRIGSFARDLMRGALIGTAVWIWCGRAWTRAMLAFAAYFACSLLYFYFILPQLRVGSDWLLSHSPHWTVFLATLVFQEIWLEGMRLIYKLLDGAHAVLKVPGLFLAGAVGALRGSLITATIVAIPLAISHPRLRKWKLWRWLLLAFFVVAFVPYYGWVDYFHRHVARLPYGLHITLGGTINGVIRAAIVGFALHRLMGDGPPPGHTVLGWLGRNIWIVLAAVVMLVAAWAGVVWYTWPAPVPASPVR